MIQGFLIFLSRQCCPFPLHELWITSVSKLLIRKSIWLHHDMWRIPFHVFFCVVLFCKSHCVCHCYWPSFWSRQLGTLVNCTSEHNILIGHYMHFNCISLMPCVYLRVWDVEMEEDGEDQLDRTQNEWNYTRLIAWSASSHLLAIRPEPPTEYLITLFDAGFDRMHF